MLQIICARPVASSSYQPSMYETKCGASDDGGAAPFMAATCRRARCSSSGNLKLRSAPVLGGETRNTWDECRMYKDAKHLQKPASIHGIACMISMDVTSAACDHKRRVGLRALRAMRKIGIACNVEMKGFI